jgi:hypothetical protein
MSWSATCGARTAHGFKDVLTSVSHLALRRMKISGDDPCVNMVASQASEY